MMEEKQTKSERKVQKGQTCKRKKKMHKKYIIQREKNKIKLKK